MDIILSLHVQALVAVGQYRSGFCEKLPEVPSCLAVPMVLNRPTGSVRNGGNASVITFSLLIKLVLYLITKLFTGTGS